MTWLVYSVTSAAVPVPHSSEGPVSPAAQPASKPIRMVTDPRPARLQSPPLPEDSSVATALEQSRVLGSGAYAMDADDGATDAKLGTAKAPQQSKGGIGRHRLPEADPKLAESKAPAKACCGGCSIM